MTDPRRPVRLPVVVGAAALALAGVLYLVGYLLGGDLPRRAAISGVPVGGLSRDEALTRLEAELGPLAAAPIAVTADGSTVQIVPAQAGLAVDLPASVDAAGAGRSLAPSHVVRVLLGGGATEAVVLADQTRLAQAVAGLAADVDAEPRDAGISLDGAKIVRTAAKPGLTVQQEAAATAVREGYLSGAPVALPVEVSPPEVTDEEADRVAAEVATPAVSGPIRVSAQGAGSFSLTPAMIGRALTFRPADGTLAPVLDPDALLEAAGDSVDRVESSRARDATVRIVDGKPKVVPAVDGTRLRADTLADAVRPVLTGRGDERRATVQLSGAAAAFSTDDARKLGVREVTGKFTTYFPYAAYRNVNIGRAAELINGTLLKPGQTFSLNKVVGERTKANGFTEGLVISNNTFKRELGGGVSQLATTTFNAAFFAGLTDVEHRPHTLFISRYPPGREATVSWPDLDLSFRNDTKYGVLVQAYLTKSTPSSRGSITVRMWSTKTYDSITSSPLVRSNYTSGTDVTDDSPDCEPQDPAPGFDVDYQRIFRREGKVVKREDFSWRYAPTNKVTCS